MYIYKYKYFQSTFVRMVFGVNNWEIGNVIFKVRIFYLIFLIIISAKSVDIVLYTYHKIHNTFLIT